MIPCIGITDSDIDSGLVMFPVPGNDESLESLCYYSDIVANHILIRKFEQIIFFISQRPISRYMNFRNWLLNKYLTQSEAYLNEKEPIKLKIHVGSLQTIFSTNILSAIHLLFGRNLKTANNKLSYFSFRPKTSSKFEANIFAYTMLSRLRLR